MKDLAFLYREPATQAGSYRSDVFGRGFGAHLRYVLKTDTSFGHPVGAASLVAASLERGLSLCKDGVLSNEPLPRKGRKSALSFVPVPWAARAASYLPPILTLTVRQWREIFVNASQFVNLTDNAVTDLLGNHTSDGDSTDGYADPRSQIVVSDDDSENDENGMAGPSGSGSADFEPYTGNDTPSS